MFLPFILLARLVARLQNLDSHCDYLHDVLLLKRYLDGIMDDSSTHCASGYSTGSSRCRRTALCNTEQFMGQKHDYLIVGGGTAGLVLAARLTENSNVQVAVVEAGKNRMEDMQIIMPALFTKLLSNPDYDWMHTTAPQVCL